jgi:hypothetical protein
MHGREEIIWAAGLFEGEGCFSRTTGITYKDGTKQQVARAIRLITARPMGS